jgi:hypothetical protein
MTRVAALSFRIAWVSLAIIGIAILIFGIVIVVLPTSSDTSYLRAVGVALVGMGIFGTVITTTAFRRRERWAWFVLWYYPVFWAAHLAGTLPPWQRSRTPGRVHRRLAHRPAAARPRLLPRKDHADRHALVKVPTA